jgi:hypothetical protein
MKIFWVIQGHTKWVDRIIASFKGCENVIWCTEKDSPDLDKIRNSNIQLITIDRVPETFGRLLIHSTSATVGIEEAIRQGADYIIKLRSDLEISDHNKFIETMNKDKKLYGNCYVSHTGRFRDAEILTTSTNMWLDQFNDRIDNRCNLNYITDWIHYGPAEEILLYYKNVYTDRLEAPVICEVRFQTSYLLNKGLRLDFSYDNLTKYIGIFMGDMYSNGVSIYSLKENFDYSRMWDPTEPRALPEAYLK